MVYPISKQITSRENPLFIDGRHDKFYETYNFIKRI
jgi:hypothetical protein